MTTSTKLYAAFQAICVVLYALLVIHAATYIGPMVTILTAALGVSIAANMFTKGDNSTLFSVSLWASTLCLPLSLMAFM